MSETQGFQVKARDHDGNVHDERWTASRAVAEQVVRDLQHDPLVDAAWIDGEPEAFPAISEEK